jgi:transposase
LAQSNKRIERLTDEIKETYEQSKTNPRLATIPGVGVLSATIIAATTPDVDNFDCASDYTTWLGLTPKPRRNVIDDTAADADFSGADYLKLRQHAQ